MELLKIISFVVVACLTILLIFELFKNIGDNDDDGPGFGHV